MALPIVSGDRFRHCPKLLIRFVVLLQYIAEVDKEVDKEFRNPQAGHSFYPSKYEADGLFLKL